MSASSRGEQAKRDRLEPACPIREQCPEKTYTDGKARYFAGFFDPCGNDECFPDAEDADDVDPDVHVVVGRGRATSHMHRVRHD